MTDPDFPEHLLAFIREAIPNVDAAELLVLLARDPERRYSLPELIDTMHPTQLSDAAARRYLGTFEARRLVDTGNDGYRYNPDNPELDGLVRALTRVYNERPVTLVRMIYAPADEKIRSFADAFRIKK